MMTTWIVEVRVSTTMPPLEFVAVLDTEKITLLGGPRRSLTTNSKILLVMSAGVPSSFWIVNEADHSLPAAVMTV